jgi:hypothetical protein
MGGLEEVTIPDYRRNFVPGGTYFFTVALLERKWDLLVAEVALLREAVRRVKRLYPFDDRTMDSRRVVGKWSDSSPSQRYLRCLQNRGVDI